MSLLVILGCRAALSAEDFNAWGWRIPFLVSILLLAISVWIRLKLNESAAFRRMQEDGKTSKAPLTEAFARWKNLKVVLLASGALSHKFNAIDWTPKHPRIFHESNVSRPENIASDKAAIALMEQGRHDSVLARWDDDYRKKPWEAFGAHYLQMLGAMGGAACQSKGEALSAYENARGTGNIHMWFDTTTAQEAA